MFGSTEPAEPGSARMNFFDLANLLDNDGNMQNEMMLMSFAATMLATIPVLLGNEFDVNVGLRKKREVERSQRYGEVPRIAGSSIGAQQQQRRKSTKFHYAKKLLDKY